MKDEKLWPGWRHGKLNAKDGRQAREKVVSSTESETASLRERHDKHPMKQGKPQRG